jgi:phosphoribosyl-dephospho-CoA transferase
LARTEGQIILRELERLPVRIDVQLDTPAGLVALAEYARSGKGVMARGAAEVRIVEDPWADRAASEGLEGTPR